MHIHKMNIFKPLCIYFEVIFLTIHIQLYIEVHTEMQLIREKCPFLLMLVVLYDMFSIHFPS